jgi:hypothetical protein
MRLEMIPCIKCKQDMPKLRLEKYGYRSCVNCSTTGAYRAVTTTHGEGDHTWNDIQLMTPEQYNSYQKLEAANSGKKITPEFNNFDDEDRNLQGPFIIKELED